MPFIAEFKTYTKKSNFRRTEFIELPLGQHTIRILDAEPKVFDTHYTHNITLLCLGDECPICDNNRKLFAEYGKEAPNTQGFIPQRQLAYTNVLDRTVVKTCPNTECQKDVKKLNLQFPPVCPKCGASLVNAQPHPMNKVKVLSKGKRLYDQIEYWDKATLDENQTPIGVQNYDLDLLVLDPKATPTVALGQNRDKVEIPEDALFNLDSAPIKLEPDEIRELLRGVRLGDIFASRKAVATTEPQATPESMQNMEAQVDEIFKN